MFGILHANRLVGLWFWFPVVRLHGQVRTGETMLLWGCETIVTYLQIAHYVGVCITGIESVYKILGGEEMGLEDACGFRRHAFLPFRPLCGFNHSRCLVSWNGRQLVPGMSRVYSHRHVRRCRS